MNKGYSEIFFYIIKSFEKLTDGLHNISNHVGFLTKFLNSLSFLHVSKSNIIIILHIHSFILKQGLDFDFIDV